MGSVRARAMDLRYGTGKYLGDENLRLRLAGEQEMIIMNSRIE